jgi:hypothetical protein
MLASVDCYWQQKTHLVGGFNDGGDGGYCTHVRQNTLFNDYKLSLFELFL